MSIVILDGPVAGPLPPYSAWLRDAGEDLVLLTGRPPDQVPAARANGAAGYAQVRHVAGYARSAEVDRAVLDLAGRDRVSAVVATAPADQIRAGALREHLGLDGQHRDDAITFVDAVSLRRHLEWSGVPTVPVASLDRPADVYLSAKYWGYPVHIRRRRYGWASVRVLADEAATRSFTQTGLPGGGPVSAPSLLIEPWSIGAGGQVAGVLDGYWRLFAVVEQDRRPKLAGGPEHAGLLAAAGAALAALPAQPHHPYLVELRRGEAGEAGGWLTDTVGCDPGGDPVAALLGRELGADLHRDAVRAQAGLAPHENASRFRGDPATGGA